MSLYLDAPLQPCLARLSSTCSFIFEGNFRKSKVFFVFLLLGVPTAWVVLVVTEMLNNYCESSIWLWGPKWNGLTKLLHCQWCSSLAKLCWIDRDRFLNVEQWSVFHLCQRWNIREIHTERLGGWREETALDPQVLWLHKVLSSAWEPGAYCSGLTCSLTEVLCSFLSLRWRSARSGWYGNVPLRWTPLLESTIAINKLLHNN